ncbi:hypothetical protein SAMN02745729_1314 [Marinobacterium iners DSM 11526]|uniref:Uncharacterized protein n=1 Tax=Marinobacterium iners DSM 11526 TaxID=1122198 RepID=A0A1H4H7D3_9GAMM|nr:hypothetical protein SAMN02745729_1314 [Marinobacterium iners DSM 11526]
MKSYVLASTHEVVQWYVFNPSRIQDGYHLIDKLDLRKVPHAGNKDTAKLWAQALGLKTYKYVRI